MCVCVSLGEAHKAYQEKYLIVTSTLVIRIFGDILGAYVGTIPKLPH